MITPETRDAVLRRDGYACQIRVSGCTKRGEQLAHMIFGDKKGKRQSKELKDWVDEFFNLAAACAVCNVHYRADHWRDVKEWHIQRMMHLDETGFLKWYKRKPTKLQDAEVRLIVARAVADKYMKGELK